MPTGYTSDVADGTITDFRDFAMRCARAFGATITMRDDPMDAEIPERFEVPDHQSRWAQEYREELDELLSHSHDLGWIGEYNGRRFLEECERYRERVAEMVATRDRYTFMLEKALAWTPPTSEHTQMKEFMVNQLISSINQDCYEIDEPKLIDHYERRIRVLRSLIESTEKSHAEDVERTAQRSEWVRALRDSLK